MKGVRLLAILCVFALIGCSTNEPEKQEYSDFVDLNLPSGTLWKNANEGDNGYFTYLEAMALYGEFVPTVEQYEELKQYCKWEWRNGGYNVTGTNKKSIWLPAGGRIRLDVEDKTSLYGCYWTSTPYPEPINGDVFYYNLFFNQSAILMDGSPKEYGHFLRLVRKEK